MNSSASTTTTTTTTSSSSSSSTTTTTTILAPYSNIITTLLISRRLWPPLLQRALLSRASARRILAAVALQCAFRAKCARALRRKLADMLVPALYRSMRCLAAVRLIQRTFISHRVIPVFNLHAKKPKPLTNLALS